ncbi:hypothetical protein EMCRGX_G031463 [Ephydatia muelleri]
MLLSFRNYESSSFHKEAVMVMVTLPSTTPDVGELLSKQHATEKQNNRHCLFEIIQCIRFLCRQGLALRGDDDDQDGNLKQLIHMKAYSDTMLKNWLVKKDNVYTSPEIPNEIIQTMSLQVLREIIAELQSSPFLTIMIDETTDSSNMEQVTLVIRHVTEELQVHEEFFGFYAVDSTDATTLVSVVKDAMRVAQQGQQRLPLTNDAKCSELGWTCIPLVAESYGAWGSEAVQAFSRLASYLATRTNSPKSKVVCSLYGRLNLTLVRANARALLLRCGCSLQEGDISSS